MRSRSVDEYIKAAAPKARPMLRKIRRLIKSAAPKAEEKISWGMPMYYYHGMMIAFGAFKEHVGFYGMTSKLLPKFKKELANYKKATGTVRFPFGEPLPEGLIKKMVRERVRMNGAKKKK